MHSILYLFTLFEPDSSIFAASLISVITPYMASHVNPDVSNLTFLLACAVVRRNGGNCYLMLK
jgi:hypothetical protein